MSEPTGSLLEGQPDAGLFGGDGGNGGNAAGVITPQPGASTPKPWLEQISAEFRTNPAIAEVNDVNDLTKRYIEQAGTLTETTGKLENAIFKPGEGATKADVKAFHKALGVPDSVDGYGIQRPDNMPEGLEYDEALEKGFLEAAHKAGMTTEHAQTALDFYNNMVIEAYKQLEEGIAQAKTDTKAELEKDWKDDMKANVQKAEKVLERFDKDGKFRDSLEKAGLLYDPAGYRMFHAIASVMSEDTLMASPEGGSPMGIERTKDGTPALDFSNSMNPDGSPKK